MAELEAKASGAAVDQPTVSEVPKGRKAATLTEQVLATPVARAALGLATPLVGAVQFGANVGDYINEKIGQKPVVGKAISDWWNEVQAMKERGMAATSPEAALGAKPRDIIGTAAGIVPALMQPSTAVTKGQQILEGMKQGAVIGTMQPGTNRLSDQAIGGATGTVLGGVAPVALPAVAKAAGWIWDAVGGRLIQVKAGKILREISGDNLSAIQTANANAAPGLTSAQAVQEAGTIAPAYQAMNQRAPTANIAAAKANKEAADTAARAAQIESVTPDIEAARIAREAAAGPLYEQARKAAAKVSPELQDVFGRLPKGTLEKAADLARMDGRPFIVGETKAAQSVPTGLLDAAGQPITKTVPATTATISGESLHYIKRALSDIANASPATGMGKDTQAVARNVLTDYLKIVESKNVLPIYGQARQTFAQESAPVNQAQILNKMLETLKGSGTTGEKPAQFLNALGQGESALLKRADQNPRFGGINEVLTPPQMGAVNKVAGELKREADMAALAQQGREALAGILKERPTTVPGINTVSAVVNRVASVLRGRVSEKTLETISKGMQTGKGANELLATLPSAEREAVLMALGEMRVSGATAGIVGGNALTPTRKNQNAMAR
jgi:histone H3/H4